VLFRLGRWDRLRGLLAGDLDLARKHGLEREQASFLMRQGMLEAQLGQQQEAGEKLAGALELFRSAGDRAGSFLCRSKMARLAMNANRYQQGQEITRELLAEAKACREMRINLAMLHMYTGRFQQAIEAFDREADDCRQDGDRWNEGFVTGHIGNVHFDREDYSRAAGYYQRSIEICRQLGNVYSEHISLYNLALCRERLGDIGQALEHYRRDLVLARQLGNREDQQELAAKIRELEGPAPQGA
jgi:tetratricopeptide (TPR) repeat protein